MLKLVLSAIVCFGIVGCNVDDEIKDISCSNTLKVDAGSDKTVTVNEEIVISGTASKKNGVISEYEWRKGTETLSTSNSFSYIPTTVGSQVLTFVVTDDNDCKASDDMTLTVKPVVNSDTSTQTNSNNETEVNTQTNSDNEAEVDTQTNSNDEAEVDAQTNSNNKYSWTNGEIKATVTSLKKTAGLITLTVVYENLSDKDIKFTIYKYKTYLLDENGAIWNFQEDSASFYDGGRTIFPSKKIVTNMKFKAKNSQNGTKFDLVVTTYYREEINHRILNIIPN